MTNRKNWLGVLVIVLVFGVTVVGCDDGSGSADPALNGTWSPNGELEYTFNNGNFELIMDGTQYVKGTYTTSGNKITITPTHVNGEDYDLESKLYTIAEFKKAMKEHYPDVPDAEIDALVTPQTATYSVSGNTAILDGRTYTKK